MVATTQLTTFRRKIAMDIDCGQYLVSTAKTHDEITQALALRYQVFFGDKPDSLADGIDVDEYDDLADHLILTDKATNQVVGTYRMLCSQYTDHFYTQTEFDMTDLLELPGIKLELGRACVHEKHRGTAAIQILWKGMTTYFQLCGARYMFGCSSVDSHLKEHFASIHRALFHYPTLPLELEPTPLTPIPYDIDPDVKRDGCISDPRKGDRLLPPLLKAYLKAGAQVGSRPYWDPMFQTLDYFTWFDAHNIQGSYGRKFGI